MASLTELIELNNNGDLGNLLAQKFNGQIGRQYPRKDSEFMIGFASQEVTPPAEKIAKVVTEHYTGLGYKVEPDKHQGRDCFQALVFFKAKDQGCTHIVITTFYPLVIGKGDKHNYLRVTTSVFV